MAETPVGPGTLLAGRFVLEDLLDETGGARLWRATDRILARDVAVHVISEEDPRSAALLNAARTSATVSDGHLLRVLDAATEDGITYVVNEWGHGISLDRLLAEGPLSARRAAWVAKEVAEAISTAHRHGIAHGRLLPENVMVTEAGAVKLIGFVVDAVLRGREQVRLTGGRALAEHEGDVLNLAALLYAGLTARWPGTDGSTVPDAPVEHGRPLRPRQVRAGVPRPLDAICERALNGDAAGGHRLETAHEIYAALCDFIGDPSAAAPVEFEPTTFFDEDELAQIRGDAPATAEHEPIPDGDATVAGTPVFTDDDTGGGWAPGADPEATQAAMPPPSRGTAPRKTPSPPPAFPPLEERPLFASDAPRPPRTPSAPRSTGAGNGVIPPAWGPEPEPDRDSGSWDSSAWSDEPPGRSWLRLAVVIASVVLVIVAVVVAFNLGQGSGPEETTVSPSPEASSAPARPVQIASVTDFDPQGDPPEENSELAPLAADGNPQTAWRTSTYFDPINLLKDGVGLLVDLGRPTEVSEVTVSFLGSPTSFEVLAAGEDAAAPTSTEELTRVATQQNAGARARVPLDDPTSTRYLVVWLTSLPAADGGYRGQVSEIAVR